jgi:hypothetical protein
MEGYCELQEAVENDYGSSTPSDEDDDEEGGELNAEADAAIVTEMRAAIEAVLEAEDYTPDELASIISTMTDALEEIDPEVFDKAVAEDEDYDDDEGDDDDIGDYDEDDYDEDEDDEVGGTKKKLVVDEDTDDDDDDDEKPRKPARKR